MIDTGHGIMTLEIFEDGIPPHWRLRSAFGMELSADDIAVETIRPNGAVQTFRFTSEGNYLDICR